MFDSISWRQYGTGLTITLPVYYLLIIVFYYRKELVDLSLSNLFKGRKARTANAAYAISQAKMDSVLSSAVNELMSALNIILRKAAQRQYAKEELVLALQLQLRRYDRLKGTQFQDPIIAQIKAGCETICNIRLDDTELAQLW